MKKVLLLLIVLIVGFCGVFLLSKSLEGIKPKPDESKADDDLYFSAQQLSAVGHDFRGLIADWYWINSLQYLGNKIVANSEKVNINDLRPLNPRLLYPMLDTAATLDPKFLTVYSYGATVLPAIDAGQAVKLLEKGIAANPDEWRIYHNLGYIYWQMKDYQKAAEIYSTGSTKKDAPIWMKQMSANMQAQGGSRDFALQIYRQMFETAEDAQTKNFAELRYMEIESLNERDAIQSVLQNFQKRNNRCVTAWREIYTELRTVKTAGNQPLYFNSDAVPVDPLKVPYLLINRDGKCDVNLDWQNSKIPVQ